MTAYIDYAFFQDHTIIDWSDLVEFQSQNPGRLERLFASWSRFVDGLLRKRYVVPFVAPFPVELQLHLTRIVTSEVMKIRGYTHGTSQKEVCDSDYEMSMEFFKELRDAEKGMLELPLKEQFPEAEGVAKGAPLGYSEQSPYEWTDVQVEAVRG